MGWEMAVKPGEKVAKPTPSAARRTSAGVPLPGRLQAALETESGLSLDSVRVHYGSDEPDRVGAHAFASGSQIHLAPGQEGHLAHEAWHTVQQRQGRVKPTGVVAGRAANVDSSLESEADRMGATVMHRLASGTGSPEGRIRRRPDRPDASPPHADSPSRIRRRLAADAAGPANEAPARRIRSQRSRPHASVDVLQGAWIGVPDELSPLVAESPAEYLLQWAYQNAGTLSPAAGAAAELLERIVHDDALSDALELVENFLRQTLWNPDVQYALAFLVQAVPHYAKAGLFESEELPGDHPEDELAGSPEIPIEEHNLDALVFSEIDPDDDGLRAIAARLINKNKHYRKFADVEPWYWLQALQHSLFGNAPVQANAGELAEDPEGLAQYKFKAGTLSGPKSYAALNGFNYQGVQYTRDGAGSIDFGSPTMQTAWTSPESGGLIDLTMGVNQAKYPDQGKTSGGTLVRIPGGSRPQHFSIANRIVGNGYGQNSPPTNTWHHTPAEYYMIEVDYTVHMKHGHNGGNVLWT